MPDPLQRITAILREHPCCVRSGHEDALAAVLVETLGLTEEVATVPELVGRVEHTTRSYRRKGMSHMNRLRKWWRDRGGTSWIYCPKCHHDLNGDGYSFAQHGMGDHLAYYRCATCGLQSKFDLDAPVPLYVGDWSA